MNESVTKYLKSRQKLNISTVEHDIERESFTLGADSPQWNDRNADFNRTGLRSTLGDQNSTKAGF